MASRLQSLDATTAVKRARSAEQSKSGTPTVENSFDFEDAPLPPFLRLDHEEISSKFDQINARQRDRLEHQQRTNDPQSPWTQHASNADRPRNRYLDIKPWDKSRVKLNVPDGCSDYINASPIELECSRTGQKRRYIATQGPKEAGVEHFWQMVWQETQAVAVIIMLTQLHEGFREKCFQYFPDSVDSAQYQFRVADELGEEHEAVLRCRECSYDELAKTSIRTLQIESQERTKTIYHLFFLGWPDFGVPGAADRSALLELIKLSREKNSGWVNPRIVHCSAGVGRTGSFIALEHLLAELEVGALENLDDVADDPVFETVNELRQQRMTMVQSELQFQFLYELLQDATRAKLKEKMIAEKMRGMSTGQESPSTGEPAHKAMRFTRAVRGVWTGLRERSSSGRPGSRAKDETHPEKRPQSASSISPDSRHNAEKSGRATPATPVEDLSPPQTSREADGEDITPSIQVDQASLRSEQSASPEPTEEPDDAAAPTQSLHDASVETNVALDPQEPDEDMAPTSSTIEETAEAEDDPQSSRSHPTAGDATSKE